MNKMPIIKAFPFGVLINMYMNMYQSNTTKILSNKLFYYLGQKVSTLTDSSSGSSKIQVLT